MLQFSHWTRRITPWAIWSGISSWRIPMLFLLDIKIPVLLWTKWSSEYRLHAQWCFHERPDRPHVRAVLVLGDSRSSSRRRRRDWIEPDNLFQKKETKCEWLAHAQYVEVTPSRCAPAASPWLTAARSVRRPTGPPTSLSAPSPTQSRRTRQ